jgi:Tfp pilus assembly protein PilP
MNVRLGIAVLLVAGTTWAQNANTVASSAPQVSVANRPATQSKKRASRPVVSVEDANGPAAQSQNTEDIKNLNEKKINIASRRDPFVSPVVNRTATGSGCSNGKRCLAIDQIALKGVVRSDAGMIAVVTNALEKAYFLHENDPVFNGYVVKITGDSIIFKETVQDKLGKTLTREVTKKITTPAV